MSKNEFLPALTKHGKPGWLAPDGRIIPAVAGASDAGIVDPHVPDPQDPPVAQDPPAPSDEIRIPVQPQLPQDQPPTDPDKVFTAADLERARKEEKDKLYPQLSRHEEEIKRLREEREAREAAEAEAQRQAEEEARRQAEEEMTVRELLQQKEQEWNQKFEEIQAEREREAQIFEMERQLQAVERYAAQRLQAEEENIMPELRDLVRGTSQEEIDAAIDFAKERTALILGNVAAATQQQRQPFQRGASVTAPPVGPMENDSSYKTLSQEDLRNMDINEYAQNRDQLLAAAREQAKNGLYGR